MKDEPTNPNPGTRLTAHFTLEEFQKADPIPPACIAIFAELAAQILEPVRAAFPEPLIITSGYRSPKENAEAHGQPNSEHIATTFNCACDFYISSAPVSTGAPARVSQREVFDWMRLNPWLPYHQLIFEHGPNNSSVIHVSLNKMEPGLRSVKEGSEHNASPYVNVDHVAFAPDAPDANTKAAAAAIPPLQTERAK